MRSGLACSGGSTIVCSTGITGVYGCRVGIRSHSCVCTICLFACVCVVFFLNEYRSSNLYVAANEMNRNI